MSTETEQKLKVTKQSRKTLRASVTRDVKKVTEQFATVTSDNQETASILMKRLKQYQTDLNEQNEFILMHLPDAELADDSEKSQEYSDTLMEAIDTLEVRLTALASQNISPSLSHHSAASDFQSVSGLRRSAKLQKLELTKFAGDPLKWAEFWDDFDSTVDSHPELSTIDKFKYLKQCLEEDALRVANGYTLTTVNYDQVKAKLLERYGDPEVAIFAHFEALLAISPANHDISQLSNVRDEMEAHIRSLVALGLSEDTFGSVFCPIILSKLPKYVKMELHRKKGHTKWTLPLLRSLLKEEMTARDKSERTSQSQDTKRGKGGKQGGTDGKGTATTLLNNGGASGSKKTGGSPGSQKSPCAYCAGDHAHYACNQNPTSSSRMERIRGHCSACLQKGHVTKQCKTRKPCYYCKKSNHHSSLCFEKFGQPGPSKFAHHQGGQQAGGQTYSGSPPLTAGAQPPPNSSAQTGASFWPYGNGSGTGQGFGGPPNPPLQGGSGSPQTSTVISPKSSGFAVSKSAIVTLSAGSRIETGQAFFDDGSTMSFITPQKARSLGARVVEEGYTDIGSFGSNRRRSVRWRAYEVKFHLPDGNIVPVILHESGSICSPMQLVALDPNRDPFLLQVPLAQPLLATSTMAEVDILIGLDYYYDFIGPEAYRSSSGVVLLCSAWGYITSGFVRSSAGGANSLHISSMASQLCILPTEPDSLQRLWEIEEIGIKDKPGKTDDEIALQHFNETISQNATGRYEAHLPFKVERPDLSNTFQLAYGRLRSQLNRLTQNPEVLNQISQVFDDQIASGIIELAPNRPQGVEYYMPHHCIFDPTRESTKVRIVFDASAKTSKNSLSLNDSVYRGPVFPQDLVGILMRLRMSPIAISADIAKAFHQVSLTPIHRDVTRFFWLKDVTKPLSKDNIVIYRFARVPFGINASPFLLAAALIHHLKKEGGQIANDILSNLYVDNVFAGATSTAQALDFYRKSKSLFSSAHMNLRQFYSNDQPFTSFLPVEDRGALSSAKLLGVQWDLLQDSFGARVGTGCSQHGSTKRSVLSALASVYDPCGWMCPVTITAKLLMQTIWKRGSDCDSVLPPDILESWKSVQTELSQINSVTIPRYHFETQPQSFELHTFSDASTKAYAAVLYLVIRSPNQTARLLLFGKARVAPLKDMTVPRLELLGAWIASKLIRFVSDQLRIPLDRRVLWCDSMCVVGWTTNTAKTATTAFVRNRVKEIQELKGLEIRYVPSAENPADMASRGVTVEELKSQKLWWQGPDFLESEDQWPNAGNHHVTISEPPEIEQVMVVADTSPPELFIELASFSTLLKLLRVTCLIFRIVRRKKNTSLQVIPASEIGEALSFWNHYIQEKYMPTLVSSAKVGPITPFPNLSVHLSTDGLLRCTGRFQNANLPYDTKYPILLPRKNHFTFLVIMACHERLFHTIAELRQSYWVPSCRSEVKSVLRECKLCRKLRGGPFKVPPPPPLPDFRVLAKRPFACTGLDYLGSLLVSSKNGDQKVWVALFTCSTTRALYLDVVDTLSTSDFLLCLRRFVALYDTPNLMCSDNARQFHTAEKVLKRGNSSPISLLGWEVSMNVW